MKNIDKQVMENKACNKTVLNNYGYIYISGNKFYHLSFSYPDREKG